MNISILFIFILSHMLADFTFQSDEIAKKKDEKSNFNKNDCFALAKERNRTFAILKHVFFHTITTIVLLVISFFILNLDISNLTNKILIYSGIVFSTHFILDLHKSYISIFFEEINKYNFRVITFSFDQFWHLFFLVVTWIVVFEIKSFNVDRIIKIIPNLSVDSKFLLTLIIFVFCLDFSNYFIRALLTYPKETIKNMSCDKNGNKGKSSKIITTIKKSNSNDLNVEITEENATDNNYNSTLKFGSVIGKIERILIALFFVVEINTGVIIIISIKTLTRFKAIEEDKDFSEYYLLGTLSSILFGFISAILLKYIW